MIEYERSIYNIYVYIYISVYKLGREEFDGDDSDRGTSRFASASQHA